MRMIAAMFDMCWLRFSIC